MDPLSISTGALAIVGVTYTSAKALFDAVQSFRTCRTDAQRLSRELAALQEMLTRLDTFARRSSDPSAFEGLHTPLKQCALNCDDVRRLVEKCTRHGRGAEGERRSLRDWAALRYKGREIRQFVDEIGAYKDIIGITISGVTLQKAELTLDFARRFDDHIDRTESYFETVIERINDQLERLHDIRATCTPQGDPSEASTAQPNRTRDGPDAQQVQISCQEASPSGDRIALAGDISVQEISRFERELASAEACLEICGRFRAHINEMRFQPSAGTPSSSSGSSSGSIPFSDLTHCESDSGSTATSSVAVGDVTKAQVMMISALKQTTDLIAEVEMQLQTHRQDSRTGLETARSQTLRHCSVNDSDNNDSLQMQERQLVAELGAAKQCRALTNRIRNMSAGKGAKQLLVSQFDQLWDVENVTAGENSLQAVGSMPDAAIVALAESRTR